MEVDSIDSKDSVKTFPMNQVENNLYVNSNEIESQVNYSYIGDITKRGFDFWTDTYTGALAISKTYFFSLPNNYRFGLGVNYTLAGYRNNFNYILFNRYALQTKIVHIFKLPCRMSLQSFLGTDFAFLQWTGPESKVLSKNNEYGLGLIMGFSWLYTISKNIQIGPDISIIYNRRTVRDLENYISPSITYFQAGLTVTVPDKFKK